MPPDPATGFCPLVDGESGSDAAGCETAKTCTEGYTEECGIVVAVKVNSLSPVTVFSSSAVLEPEKGIAVGWAPAVCEEAFADDRMAGEGACAVCESA